MYNLSSVYTIAMVKIPDIIGGIDNISKSQVIWNKVKILAIFIFLLGGIYYTIQAWWYKIRGIDEYEKHRSIYKATFSNPTNQNAETTQNAETAEDEDVNTTQTADEEGLEEDQSQQEPPREPNRRRNRDRTRGRRD